MDIAFAILALVLSVAMYYRVESKRIWILNPTPYFVAVQLLMFLGSVPLLNLEMQADRVNFFLMAWSISSFIFVVLACRVLRPVRGERRWWDRPAAAEAEKRWTSPTLLGLLVVSIMATVYYFQIVGYNVLDLSLQSLAKSGELLGTEEAKNLRLQSSFGEAVGAAYYAPGYFAQFRNVLLPALCAAALVRGQRAGSRRWTIVGCLATLVALWGLFGTGQRGPLVIAVVVWAAFFAACRWPQRTPLRALASWLCVGAVLLFFATTILGRYMAGGGGFSVQGVVEEMYDRFLLGDQTAAVEGFRFIYAQLPDGGLELMRDVTKVVPRGWRVFGESTLPEDVFQQIHRSRVGNAEVSQWAFAWYGFGPLGGILCGPLLGFWFEWVARRLYHRPRSVARMLEYAGYTATMGLWLAGTIGSLFDHGLITYFIMGRILAWGWGTSGTRPALVHPPVRVTA